MCSCFLGLCPLKKYFEVETAENKNTMETYRDYSLQEPIVFMYFWLNYRDENYHIERIPVAVKNIDHLFRMATEIIEADRLHYFFLSDGTRIDDNEYLSSLENGILPVFLDGLKSRMLKNYVKTLRMIRSLKIKRLASAVFLCARLVN